MSKPESEEVSTSEFPAIARAGRDCNDAASFAQAAVVAG
jgi:hypothetical protein